jgi:hypothetical protein
MQTTAFTAILLSCMFNTSIVSKTFQLAGPGGFPYDGEALAG